MPGVLATPAASYANEKSIRALSHHRYCQRTGIPCAMVLTVSFVLFPAIGLFVTVVPEKR